MTPGRQTGLQITSAIAAVLLLSVAVLSFLWGVFCFLGGPEGNPGSRDSIVYGTGFVVFALTVGGIAAILLRVAMKAFPMGPPPGQL